MNRTKQEISETLWQLLNEKPYSKITVQNIVERCRINRSTFYYHFSDIPAVLEYAVASWTDEIITQEFEARFPLGCIRPIANECTKRSRACMNIYRSIHREEFLIHLNRVITHALNFYADQVLQEEDVSAQEREQLIWFSRCIFSGVILDWFDSGMSYDVVGRVEALSNSAATPAALVWYRNLILSRPESSHPQEENEDGK